MTPVALRVGLIGCGGRGTGAAAQALRADKNVKLVALGDVFEDKLQKATGYRTERFEGRFQRSVALPKAVQADKVRAAYKDGILTVTLPIAAEARPKQILVGAE